MAQIFISYSRKDVDFARKLAASLSELGAEVWIDVEDIPTGMNWSTAIQQGLDQCEALLLVMSPESMASRNVENEWQYFLDQGKPVIPIRWRPAKPHFQLNRLQYQDFHNRDYDQAFRSLHFALIYQGVKLPAVKGDPQAPISPHSTPFTKTTGTPTEQKSSRFSLKIIGSAIAAVTLIIAVLLGGNVLNDDGGDETNQSQQQASQTADVNPLEGTIADILSNEADLQNIADLATAPSFQSLLSSTGPYTFFAPSDFYLNDNQGVLLMNPDDFASAMRGHLVVGRYSYEELQALDGQQLETVDGTQITITFNQVFVSVYDDDIVISRGDIQASNGVIHIIDGFIGIE